jgi:four helix bundle protein
MSNLAEGSGRTSRRDQAHFYQLAYSSLMEVDAQLQLSVDLGFMLPELYDKLRMSTCELANKINALRHSCLKEK